MSDTEHGAPDSGPAILCAARVGDLAALEAALADRPDAIYEIDDQGSLAIHYAAARGDLPCIQALLAAGADPDAPGANGVAPLAVAAFFGHTAVVNALLEAGADMEATCSFSSKKGGAPFTALQWAALEGRDECLRALLAAGASLEAPQGPKFYPALHLAAEEGHSDCLYTLLEAKAPLEARDSDGNTALIVACYHGQADCMGGLVLAGADMEARGSRGTALQVAVAESQGMCATALMGLGARTVSLPRVLLRAVRLVLPAGLPCVKVAFIGAWTCLLCPMQLTSPLLPCAAPTMHNRGRWASRAWPRPG